MLRFDRGVCIGLRLNVPAGTAVRFEPGETKEVPLVPISGNQIVRGGNNLIDGPAFDLDKNGDKRILAQRHKDIMDRMAAGGFLHQPGPKPPPRTPSSHDFATKVHQHVRPHGRRQGTSG